MWVLAAVQQDEALHTLLVDSTSVRAHQYASRAAWPASCTDGRARRPQPYDAARYAQRHSIERLFSRLKQFHRVATRYEKQAARFLAFVQLVATVLWLRDC